ncbi:MAG: hypothetical protein HY744_06550 [Deltaproteobacteria bacterium]|nr:hypothetical protein [Deltaproteobacteria bacterium]
MSLGTHATALAPGLPSRVARRVSALRKEEIAERLRYASKSPKLIAELHDTAKREIDSESTRRTSLESKAASLLTAVGVSLTVVLTIGGKMLIDYQAHLAAMSSTMHWLLGWCGTLSVVLLLAAAFLTVVTLRVTDSYRRPAEDAIFNEQELREAWDLQEDERGVAGYQRFIVPHLWMIAQANSAANTAKANWLQNAQRCYLGFLCTLLVAFAVLVVGL